MTSRALWCRIALLTVAAIILGLALSPPVPHGRVAPAAAIAIGLASGVVLFAAAARCVPRPPRLRPRTIIELAKQTVLGLCAANEEIIWRRAILGELLPVGSLVAVAASSAVFAAAHHRSRPLHLATGCAFGTLYAATGVLGACIAAHWLYNAFVATLVERAPP